MVYVGVDVSGKSLVAYAVNERKQRVFEGEQPATRAGVRALLRQVGAGAKLVSFEAGNQMKWIAETLKTIDGVQVYVVHPNEVTWITESRGKTDRVDAKKLAELAQAGLLPRAVPVVAGPVRELRELVSARHVAEQTHRVDQDDPGVCVSRGSSPPGEVLCGGDVASEAGPVAGERPAAADP